jgi:hypothetical protein
VTPPSIYEQAAIAKVRTMHDRLSQIHECQRLHTSRGGLPTLATLRACVADEIGGRRADRLIEEMVQRGALVLSVDERGRIWVSIAGEVSYAPAQ